MRSLHNISSSFYSFIHAWQYFIIIQLWVSCLYPMKSLLSLIWHCILILYEVFYSLTCSSIWYILQINAHFFCYLEFLLNESWVVIINNLFYSFSILYWTGLQCSKVYILLLFDFNMCVVTYTYSPIFYCQFEFLNCHLKYFFYIHGNADKKMLEKYS